MLTHTLIVESASICYVMNLPHMPFVGVTHMVDLMMIHYIYTEAKSLNIVCLVYAVNTIDVDSTHRYNYIQYICTVREELFKFKL